jgi:hypothetical protein
MRKTILGLLGSTLIVASMANAAVADEHLTRHHKKYASKKTYTSKTVRNAPAWQDRNVLTSENRPVYWPKDQYSYSSDTPWPSGRIQPDDPRQFGNK